MPTKLLTPLELKVMNVLWRLKQAFVKDIIESWPDPNPPAYNTVSTVLRLLEDEKKGAVVAHKAFGRSHQYYATISRAQYQQRHLKAVVTNVFSGSFSGLVSTLLADDNLDEAELENLRRMIEENED